MGQQTRDVLVSAKLEIALWTKRRVDSHSNAELLAESNKLLLRQIWVELNLVHSRLDSGVTEHIDEKSSGEVTAGSINIRNFLRE